jgi:hypothetical protein
MKFGNITLFVFVSIIGWSACKSSDNQEPADAKTVAIDTISGNTSKVNDDGNISQVPFSFELIEQLYQSKISFNNEILSSPNNLNKYSRAFSKALNLGVYGADLSYVITYEQFQMIAIYTKNCKKMTEELNLSFAFNDLVMQRFEEYKDNKDSLSRFVFTSFKNINGQLKTEDRLEFAMMVLVGNWVESVYLAANKMNVGQIASNALLNKVLANQKQSLEMLLTLIEPFKNNENSKTINQALIEIQKLFNQENDDTLLTEQQITALSSKIAELRNKIVNNSL